MGKENVEIVQLLKNFKNEINRRVKINRMILFGSRAKGKERKNSDVDLIIISEDFAGKKSFMRSPQFYLTWDYPYNVDIICLTPRELNEKKKQIGIIREALKEGIEIK